MWWKTSYHSLLFGQEEVTLVIIEPQAQTPFQVSRHDQGGDPGHHSTSGPHPFQIYMHERRDDLGHHSTLSRPLSQVLGMEPDVANVIIPPQPRTHSKYPGMIERVIIPPYIPTPHPLSQPLGVKDDVIWVINMLCSRASMFSQIWYHSF